MAEIKASTGYAEATDEIQVLRARVAELEGAAVELARLKSEVRDAGQAHSLEQEFCRALLEHLPDGVVACNAEGKLVLFNQTSRDWHGMDAMQLPPEEWASRYDLFGPDGKTALPVDQIPLVRAYRGERVRDAGMTIVARGQAPRALLCSGDPVFDKAGRKVGAVAIMYDVTAQRRAEEARRASEEVIRAQAASLAELSTPLIPINEDVVVMPLIGMLDSHRVQQVMSTLLTGIAERRARVAILDITGVSVVDTQVANGLISAARAAQLLGSEVVLTGIRPEVARTLVGRGVRAELDLNQRFLKGALGLLATARLALGGLGARCLAPSGRHHTERQSIAVRRCSTSIPRQETRQGAVDKINRRSNSYTLDRIQHNYNRICGEDRAAWMHGDAAFVCAACLPSSAMVINSAPRIMKQAVGEEGKAEMTSVADQLREEGRRDGEAEGLLRGQRKILVKLLTEAPSRVRIGRRRARALVYDRSYLRGYPRE